MKILPVGAEFFHADGQTDRLDMTKLIFGFHNVVKASKKFVLQTYSYITRPTPTPSRVGFRAMMLGKMKAEVIFRAIDIYGGVKEQFQAFSTLSLDGHKRYLQVLAALSRENLDFFIAHNSRAVLSHREPPSATAKIDSCSDKVTHERHDLQERWTPSATWRPRRNGNLLFLSCNRCTVCRSCSLLYRVS